MGNGVKGDKMGALQTSWKVIVQSERCRAGGRSGLVGMEEADLRSMKELKLAGLRD